MSTLAVNKATDVVGTSFYELMRLETAKSATGTSVEYASIPSWVKRITVMLAGVSTSGSSFIQIRLIVGGSVVSTGYLGTGGGGAFTTGFTDTVSAAAAVRHGHLVLTQFSSTQWIGSGNIARSDISNMNTIAGSVTISGTVTGIRVTTVNGTDTFDAGNINVILEGYNV
jgi:hypothetical protein